MTDPVGTIPHGLSVGLTNYGDPDFALYLRRSFARSMGYSLDMLSKPVIGIADTRSGFNNCHRHFPELIEAVKRGVLAAGGLPLVFPTISLGEVFLSPTSLMFRNLMAIDPGQGWIVLGAEVSPGDELETLIGRFFARDDVAFLHAHNARRGCYSCRIDRV